MLRFIRIFMILFYFFPNLAVARIPVTLYAPYEYEPFVISEKEQAGLMYDLQRALNERSPYRFEVQVAPRSRVLKLLEKGSACVVPWVAPEWFDDPNRTHYQWTQPLMEDENLIVSPIAAPIESLEPQSVRGKSTIMILGHKNAQIDELRERQLIKTTVMSSRRNSFVMLARHRIDFMLTGRLFYEYFVRELAIRESLHVAAHPVSRFERRILICPNADPKLLPWLDARIHELRGQRLIPSWFAKTSTVP